MYEEKKSLPEWNAPIPAGVYDVEFIRDQFPQTTITLHLPVYTETRQLERVLAAQFDAQEVRVHSIQLCPPPEDDDVILSHSDYLRLVRIARLSVWPEHLPVVADVESKIRRSTRS